MSRILELMALEHFVQGEQGHAIGDKVIRFRAGLVIDDGIIVRALADVLPGAHGQFEEVAQQANEVPEPS